MIHKETQNLICLMLQIYVIIFSVNSKQIISGYISNKYLVDSQYHINTNAEYSLCMWIRVLVNDSTTGKTMFLKMQNGTNTQTLELHIDNSLQKINIEDENNLIEQTDWPIPIQSGKLDFENHATIYDKWLPIIISKDISNIIYLISFSTSSTHQFTGKDFSLNTQSYIDFAPQNTLDYEVVFDSVILREVLITNPLNTFNYIFNNGYLGLYSYAGRSKNKQIYYNLNQTNEFKNTHLYFQEINPLLYEQDQLQNTYTLHLPSFFDSHVYYVCQFYQEINYVFNSNFSTFQTQLSKKYYYYNRILNYQNKEFNIYYEFLFTSALSSSYQIQEYVIFFNVDMGNIVNATSLSISNTATFSINRPILISIYHYPMSGFIKMNQLNITLLWFPAETTQNYNVDYQYSYYDQIYSKCNDSNAMNYIIGSQIFKIIFYRDIYFNKDTVASNNQYTLGANKNIFLKSFSLTASTLTDNFHIHDMTQIIEGNGVTNPGTFKYCKDKIPNCMFCIQHQCISCNIRYTLVDGVCIICTKNWIVFKNECLLETTLHYTDPLNTGLNYDATKFQLLSLKISYNSARNSAVAFEIKNNFLMETQSHFTEIKTQLTTYYPILKIRLAITDIFYVTEFSVQDFSICKSTKYFRIQDDFSVKCVDKCSILEHLQQQRICVQNIQGCLEQDTTGCLQCQDNYVQETSNGKIICLATQIQESTQYTSNILTPVTSTLSNCLQQISNTTCINCNSGFMLDTTTYTCITETTLYQDLRDISNCSEYSTGNGRTSCVGYQSKIFLNQSTVASYIGPCRADSVFHYTCQACTANDYYMTSLIICQECLNYDIATSQCLQCAANFQPINGECVYQSCLLTMTNCLSCDNSSLTQCQTCATNFYLVEQEGNFICGTIKDCITQSVQNSVLTCTSCNAGYVLVDQSYIQNITSGILCILEANYVDNCANYSLNSIEYTCDYCKTNYYYTQQGYCILSTNIVQNCMTYDTNTNQCIACQTGFQCQDINGVQTVQPCYQCGGQVTQANQNAIDNCSSYDVNQNCISCNTGYFGLDTNFLIPQSTINVCVQNTYNVTNCYQYDSSFNCISCTNGFQCQDNNSVDTVPPCQQCNTTNVVTIQHCSTYNINDECTSCNTGYFCIDINRVISVTTCTECIANTFNIQQCYQYDTNYECISCQQNYLCLDNNYNISNSICSHCFDNTKYIYNCAIYDSNNICTSCQTSYTCLDNLNIITNTNCVWCVSDSQLIDNCYQFNINFECISCQVGFFCLDNLLYYIVNSICQYCVPNNMQQTNCVQYTQTYQCNNCTTGYFVGFYNSNYICIQNQYFVQNCVEYNQNIDQSYFCIQCNGNVQPVNQTCENQCEQNQIYIQQQQICIFQYNYIEYCIQYGNEQQCLQCETNYNLIYIYIGNDQYQYICSEQYVQNCLLHSSIYQCDQCMNNYQISSDLSQCILYQDCDSQNCFDESQQQILYSTVQSNCILNIEFCDTCEKQDQNNCAKCQQNFLLSQNICSYDCNLQNVGDNNYQDKFCSNQDVNVYTIENLCDQVYQNCEQCEIIENKLACIKCMQNHYLDLGQCYQIIQYDNPLCQFPCLSCNELDQCIECKQSYELLDYSCKKPQQQQKDVECQGQYYCYKDKKTINQHCQDCEKICKIDFINQNLIFDLQIVLDKDIVYQNNNCFIKIDYKNNTIQIKVKDQFVDTNIQFMKEDIIYSSQNCTPQSVFIFNIQKQQTSAANSLLSQNNRGKNFLPYFSLFLSSNFNLALQLILNEMKIFVHLGFLQIAQGNVLNILLEKNDQNVQQYNTQIFKSYFQDDFVIQHKVFENQLDLSMIIGFIQNLLTEIYTQIIYMLLITLLLILQYNKKSFNQYLLNLKAIIFQYFLCKVISIQISFLIFVQDFRILAQQNFSVGFTFLLGTIILFYSYFWFIYKIQRKNQKTSKIIKKKKYDIKTQKQRRQNINDQFLIYRITFLFFKLKILFDFQTHQTFALFLFILITILEIKIMQSFNQYEYLRIIRKMDLIYNFTLIIFVVLMIIQHFSSLIFKKIIYDILFIFSLFMQLLIQIVIKLMTTYGKIRTKKKK